MLYRIWAVSRKEVLHILRDPRVMFSIFVMPLAQLFLMGYALTFDITHISSAVLDQDRTPQSRRFVQSLEGSGYFDINRFLQRESEIREVLDGGQAKVVVRIPHGMAAGLLRGETVPIQVLVDGSEPNAARVAAAYTSAMALRFSQGLIVRSLNAQGLDMGSGLQLVDLRQRVWYNPARRSANYLVPGLISIILMSFSVAYTATAIVREKESGTIENLVVSPLRPWELIAGKVVPYVVLSGVISAMISLAGIWVLGVPFRGNVVFMMWASLLFITATVGIGLVISTVSESVQVVTQLALFASLLPGFLLSGFIFPIESMPRILQLASYIVPARFYINIVRGIFLKSAGVEVLWPDVVALLVFSLVSMGMAALALKRSTA